MSFPKPTRRPSKRARYAVKRRAVYAAVTARDLCCRCCGRTYGLHRHHIVFRSQLGPTTPENVVLVCAICHEDIHARRLRVVGLDANQPLQFVMEGHHALDLSAVAHV